METEPGAAWTLIVSWSLKNNHFANFRYCYQWIKTLCRPPEKISPFLMALIPWLVLLGRSFIDAQNITLDDDRFVFDKKGCTDLMQRIWVVSQLFGSAELEKITETFLKNRLVRRKNSQTTASKT